MSNHDEQKVTENIVLYDWLSFTLLDEKYNPAVVAEEIGLADINWESIKGMHGYQERLYYNGISIHHNGINPGIWIEMSGQGCRCFETVSNMTWESLYGWILAQPAAHITRLDVAYDDHTGVLQLDDMIQDIKSNLYVTSFRGCIIEQEYNKPFAGTSIYFGSPQSAIRIRIYDKAAERKKDEHWIRVEMQLRDDRATAFVQNAVSGDDIGIVYAGVLLKYLRFIEPMDEDTNRYRWPLRDYWSDLIGDVCEIALWSSPGVEYNLEKLDNYVFGMAGNAIDTVMQIYGLDSFMHTLKTRERVSSPKYQALLDHAKALGLCNAP